MVKVDDTIGAYRVVAPLATGGMGQVWMAEHAALGRRVAIKVLKPELSERDELVERFFDEARAAAQIDDPGIVAVHDFGHHDGAAYIVMEHLGGEVLAARLARAGTLPVVVATRLAAYAAMTMAVAHARGIVHRDLKPDNLFVVPDPVVAGGERVKIVDFGVAKLIVDADVASRTQTGAILGTPMYMSPEQCRNAGTVDHRTDIYALGCVLFHMLCGRPPFLGGSAGDLIAAHLVDEPPAASASCDAVSPELDAVIARCLAKAPDDRFASMSELARELASFAELRVTIPILIPARPSKAHAATAPIATPVPRAPMVGSLTTLATGVGESRSGRPRSHARAWVALAAALAVGVVVTIGIVARDGGTSDGKAATPVPPPRAEAATPPAAPLPPPAPVVEDRKPDVPVAARPRPKRRPTPSKSPPRAGSGSVRDDGAYEFGD